MSNASVHSALSDAERDLIARLHNGDEAAFETLIAMYQPSMLRIAQIYVHDPAIAEEIVQETWIGVLQGLHRFEGRSSLKTWIFSILVNRAKTRAQREGRYVPFSVLTELDNDEPTIDPSQFQTEGDIGYWVAYPSPWQDLPEDRLLSDETMRVIREAIAMLSENQRTVITLRDIDEWSSDEVCNILQISETNQRVLLHRARAAVRRALERYFDVELNQNVG